MEYRYSSLEASPSQEMVDVRLSDTTRMSERQKGQSLFSSFAHFVWMKEPGLLNLLIGFKRNNNRYYTMKQQSHSTSPSQSTELQKNYVFLSDKAVKNLPHYQYKGEDKSLLYFYVLSPLSMFCVNRLTPSWLAPNTITLVGLVFMASSYFVMWYFSPTLEPVVDAPRWIFLFNGASMLFYQTLDNMDGKQSRKTGTSSPLGLLFDHGCDAINPLFGSVNWIIAMALHPAQDALLCFIILFGPYALFYVGTWEEYYTGELIMPIFNGPSEGLLGGAMLSFTSFVYGPNYWLQESWWTNWFIPGASRILPESTMASFPTLRNADILLIVSSVGIVQETLLKMLHVSRKYGAPTLYNLFPFFSLMACTVVVGMKDPNVWLDVPRTSLHLCALVFAEMTIELMLCHMSQDDFKPFRWPLLPLVLLSLLVGSGMVSSGYFSQAYLLVYTCALGAYFCRKVTLVVQEICDLLQIWCFDIITPRVPKSSGERAKGS